MTAAAAECDGIKPPEGSAPAHQQHQVWGCHRCNSGRADRGLESLDGGDMWVTRELQGIHAALLHIMM